MESMIGGYTHIFCKIILTLWGFMYVEIKMKMKMKMKMDGHPIFFSLNFLIFLVFFLLTFSLQCEEEIGGRGEGVRVKGFGEGGKGRVGWALSLEFEGR